jgi:tetratricopeptide (TPR) repeat protein
MRSVAACGYMRSSTTRRTRRRRRSPGPLPKATPLSSFNWSITGGFQEAVAQDSTFALAYYRLGVAAGWAERPGISGPATQKALTLGHRLDDRDRRLLSAFAAYQRGAADDAEREYRAILRDYPDDLEAEFQLADLLYHYNPARGRPIAEAREPFDHVLAQDPCFLCPI